MHNIRISFHSLRRPFLFPLRRCAMFKWCVIMKLMLRLSFEIYWKNWTMLLFLYYFYSLRRSSYLNRFQVPKNWKWSVQAYSGQNKFEYRFCTLWNNCFVNVCANFEHSLPSRMDNHNWKPQLSCIILQHRIEWCAFVIIIIIVWVCVSVRDHCAPHE